MILPTQRAYGLAASTLLQSTLDAIDARQREEQEKRLAKPKEDPVLAAKQSASEAARKARNTIASTLFDVQHEDVNRTKIKLAERLGRKLGLDVEALKANSELVSALEDALKDLTVTDKLKIEKELGLEKLGLTLKDLIDALREPDPLKKEKNSDSQKKSDPLLADEKAKQRLAEIAHPKTLAEKKAAVEIKDAGRVVDDEIKAEDAQDIRTAEASEKLKSVPDQQAAIRHVLKSNAGKQSDTGATPDAPGVDLLAIAAAAVDTVKSEAVDHADRKGAHASDEGKTGPKAADRNAAEDEQKAELARRPLLMVQIDEAGLYSWLLKQAA